MPKLEVDIAMSLFIHTFYVILSSQITMCSPGWKIMYNVKHIQNKFWIPYKYIFPYMGIT